MNQTSHQPNILIIIQARMSSSRLPGKVLLDLAGQPMLERVIKRALRAKQVDKVAVATTTDSSDDPIVDFCAARNYPCYRGSPNDVLDRYYQALNTFGGEVIVRLTADCPVVDPGVIDQVIQAFLYSRADFAANRLPPPWKRTYPIGLDTEVCSSAALEQAWKEARQPYQREHVMPYLYDHSPILELSGLPAGEVHWPEGDFKVLLLHHDPDYGTYRWTVDTAADLDLLRLIYTRFGGRADFTWLEVLELFQKEPELVAINADVEHKTAYDVDQRTVNPEKPSS